MIRFLVGVTQFFICLCTIVIFGCLFILSLSVFDYLCDTDLKNLLVQKFGKRDSLRKLRKKTKTTLDQLDTRARKDDERYFRQQLPQETVAVDDLLVDLYREENDNGIS